MEPKTFYTMRNVGKAKYLVTFYDGVQRHKDGSQFHDVRIFKNLNTLKEGTKKLISLGYTGTN